MGISEWLCAGCTHVGYQRLSEYAPSSTPGAGSGSGNKAVLCCHGRVGLLSREIIAGIKDDRNIGLNGSRRLQKSLPR